MPRACATSTPIKRSGIRSLRNQNAQPASMSAAWQPIPSSISPPNFVLNFLSTHKEPFISAWIRLWSMRQPTAEIVRTLPALNQRLPKWIQLCGIPAAWGSLVLWNSWQRSHRCSSICTRSSKRMPQSGDLQIRRRQLHGCHGGLAGQCVFAAWSCSEEPAHQRSIEPSYT